MRWLLSNRGEVSGETRSMESVRFLVAFAIADLRKVATDIRAGDQTAYHGRAAELREKGQDVDRRNVVK